MTWSRIARRIRVPLGFVLAALYLWLARPNWLFLGIGAAVALGGVAIRTAAAGHIVKNDALTTTGPYARTRNPLYFGSLVIGAGFAIAARSGWIVLAMAILFFAVYLPVIRSEEQFLRGRFSDFDDYARSVPRFIPRVTKAHIPSPDPQRPEGNFSWQRYRRHREYNALLGTLLMIAALVAKLVWLR